MANNDKAQILPQYTATANRRRGLIIDRMCTLERAMDEVIAFHFNPDKQKSDELILLLLSTDKITYEKKRLTLKWIIDTHYKSINSSNPKMLKQMQELGEFRNLLAHNHLDLTNFIENNKAGKTVLKKYEKTIKIIEITDIIVSDNLVTIIKHTNFLKGLLKSLTALHEQRLKGIKVVING